jgi:hypothetical protein
MEAEVSKTGEAEAAEDFLRPVGRCRIPMVILLLREAPVISMAVQEAAPAPGSAAAQEATEVSAAADRDY